MEGREKHFHLAERQSLGGKSVIVVVAAKLNEGDVEVNVIKPIRAHKREARAYVARVEEDPQGHEAI